jgi:hypothetical protein
MSTRVRRGVVAVFAGVSLALGGVAIAVATPAGAAEAPLTVTATDMRYGQPDLSGVRRAETTITYTNTSAETVEFPVLTFPANDRDHATHSDWSACLTLFTKPDRLVCIGHPIAPGETVAATFPWQTDSRGPGGTARVRIEQGADREGRVVPGTANRATWRVTFEKLKGSFDIAATDLIYGPANEDGVRRGTSVVTLTNLTKRTIQFPIVTFPADIAIDAEHAIWNDCPRINNSPDGSIVCIAAPLAPKESRDLTFGFLTTSTGFDYTSTVRVDEGYEDGSPKEGTAAGTSFEVIFGR